MKKLTRVLLCLIVLTLIVSPDSAGITQASLPEPDQIKEYLNTHPLIVEAGGQVLDINIMGEALVINLSEAVLPGRRYDEALFTQLHTDLDSAFNINQWFMTTFKVEGELLEAWGRPEPDFSSQPDLDEIRELPGDGPLSGVRIALSPGHGIYWNETYSQWRYQRLEFNGIREDTLNAEIMRYVSAGLLNQGATVIKTREPDLSARTGVSFYPAWHESSRQYAIAQGLPSYIWEGGSTNYNSDIRSRPYTANYFGADILISLHNNGWNGTLSGTETYYDTDNHPGSPALAKAVHKSIISAIRNEYDSSWIDRGIKPSDSAYGEINYARMPAILIELAFMDKVYPDNAYLHDETFKLLAANAITEGICAYLGVTCEDAAITLPVVLETPTLTPAFGDGICDSGWYRYPNQRGHYAYLALNANSTEQSTHRASWQPNLPVSGEYRLEAFIPAHNAINWDCPERTIQSDTIRAGYEILHANGTSFQTVNQAAYRNAWVDLGIFHFNEETQAAVRLSDVTGETNQSTTLSASAMRFTLVGNAGTQFYNTAWLDESWPTQQLDATEEHIRNFFLFRNSCLAETLQDVDGQEIEFSSLIQQTASANGVSPKMILAVMEAEQHALSHCPDQAALASLMGLEPPSSARQQIAVASARIGEALRELAAHGETPNGWKTGSPKVSLDGVTVIPANDAVSILFDFSQNAGAVWGGSVANESGVHGIYAAWRDYDLEINLPGKLINIFLPLTFK